MHGFDFPGQSECIGGPKTLNPESKTHHQTHPRLKDGLSLVLLLKACHFPLSCSFMLSGTVHGAFGTGQQAARECVQYLQSAGVTSAGSSAADSAPSEPGLSGNHIPSLLSQRTDSLADSTIGLEVSESTGAQMQNEVASSRVHSKGVQSEYLGRRKLAARL